ncbi:MAG TPA: inactive transglutaminase family protein [Pseudomonadales bacterium]
MTSRLPFYLLLLLMMLASIAMAWLRHDLTGIPLLPGEQKPVWLVEARIDFIATAEPTQVSLSLPGDNPHFSLFSELATSPGYGFSIIEGDNGRRGEWSKRDVRGPQTLYYKAQFVARQAADGDPADSDEPPPPATVVREEPEATAARQLLATALAKSSDALSLGRELVKLLNNPEPDQNAALLLQKPQDKALLLADLLNQADVPARVVMGLSLEDARRRQSLNPLLELYHKQGWVVMNPDTGVTGVPDNLLIWHRSHDGLLDVMGARNSRVSFSMIRQTIPALQLAQSQRSEHLFDLLSVYQLPIEEQSLFKILFLLPLGALVVVFMRIIVGVQTAGTFMPILIALAFLQTTLLPGLASFVLIVALGLMLRGYLSNLNLLMVARIATLVVLVVFMTSFISLIGYQLGFNTGMTITFFPMVIIAWTIERMSILWEEEGPQEVLKQGGGSLLVAVIAYLLMQLPVAGHLTFNFPELNLVLLALILLMGQYTGYRLSELRRFSDFGREAGP